jgi:hypothetical protein
METVDPANGMFMMLPMLFFGFFMLLAIAGTALWIWMLIECATKEPDTGNEKVTWILIIVLAQAIGALIYYFVRSPVRIRETGR